MIKQIFLPLLALIFFVGPAYSLSSEQKESYRIGVLAKEGDKAVYERWIPTAEYLNQTNPAYHFEIVPVKFDHTNILAENEMVDFLIVNPAIFVELAVKYDIRRILTLKNRFSSSVHVTRFGSVIFTQHNNDRIDSIADLRGKRVVAVHESSLGGWIIAQDILRQEGIERDDMQSLQFKNVHKAVVEEVVSHRVDVGIVRTGTLERLSQEGKIDLTELKIINLQEYKHFPFLCSTPLYPEWPVAVLPHVRDDIAERVAISLMQMSPEHEAAKKAGIYGWTIPENYHAIEQLLKRLKLPPYDIYGEVDLKEFLTKYWYGVFLALLVIAGGVSGFLYIVRLNRKLQLHTQELERNKSYFESVFEQAAVGILYTEFNGKILEVNHKFSEMTGYSEAETLNMNLMDFFEREAMASEHSRFQRLRQGSLDSFDIQSSIATKAGTLLWVLINVTTVKNRAHAKEHLVWVISDITLLKKLEDSLRTINKQNELILHLAGDGIFGLDMDARHTFVNEAAATMLGYDVEEMIGHHSHKMWHYAHEDGARFQEDECPIAGVLSEGRSHRCKKDTFWTKDGSPILVEYVSTPMIDEGRIIGAIVVFRKTSS